MSRRSCSCSRAAASNVREAVVHGATAVPRGPDRHCSAIRWRSIGMLTARTAERLRARQALARNRRATSAPKRVDSATADATASQVASCNSDTTPSPASVVASRRAVRLRAPIAGGAGRPRARAALGSVRRPVRSCRRRRDPDHEFGSEADDVAPPRSYPPAAVMLSRDALDPAAHGEDELDPLAGLERLAKAGVDGSRRRMPLGGVRRKRRLDRPGGRRRRRRRAPHAAVHLRRRRAMRSRFLGT